MPSFQTSAWVFTLNNPTGDDDDPRKWGGVKFISFQLEKGPSGTPHFQGYLIMEKRCSMYAMKIVNRRARWAAREGTHEQALDYVQKSATKIGPNYTRGVPPAPGQRNDILSLKRALDDGRTEASIARDDALFGTWARNIKG